jgi:hypothetical protein
MILGEIETWREYSLTEETLNDNGTQTEGIPPHQKFDSLVYSVVCLKETSCNRIITSTAPQNKSYKNSTTYRLWSKSYVFYVASWIGE